jgi:microcystin-dependent protein
MANEFYNRGATFNPDELADGDALEAEFDAVVRGFDTIKNLVNVNKAGYPTQTFFVAPATDPAHAVQKDQLDDGLALKLNATSYTAADVLSKIKTVDGSSSGLDADLLDGQDGAYYRNATNINAGTIGDAYLPATISSSITGNATTATTLQTARTINNVSFNGSANITVEPYVEQDNTSNATRYLTFVDSSSESYQRMNIDTSLAYNPSTKVLNVSVSSDVSEVGKISMFARSTAPSGYLKCNGAEISRTTYEALFSAIGTTFGAGDGSTTFNIPDLRGEFIRGWDDARGVDSGRVFGGWQDGQNVSHTHTGTTSSDAHTHTWSGTTSSDGAHTHTITVRQANDLNWDSTPEIPGADDYASSNTTYNSTASAGDHKHTVSGTTSSDAHTHTFTTAASGGTEVRVRNRALLYCIKY